MKREKYVNRRNSMDEMKQKIDKLRVSYSIQEPNFQKKVKDNKVKFKLTSGSFFQMN